MILENEMRVSLEKYISPHRQSLYICLCLIDCMRPTFTMSFLSPFQVTASHDRR
jgi:hypothetical protein